MVFCVLHDLKLNQKHFLKLGFPVYSLIIKSTKIMDFNFLVIKFTLWIVYWILTPVNRKIMMRNFSQLLHFLKFLLSITIVYNFWGFLCANKQSKWNLYLKLLYYTLDCLLGFCSHKREIESRQKRRILLHFSDDFLLIDYKVCQCAFILNTLARTHRLFHLYCSSNKEKMAKSVCFAGKDCK